jgi:hypothetical protein
MKKLLQRIAILWIAVLGLVGIGKEKIARNEERNSKAPQQQEVKLDEFELASFHN